MATRVVNVMDYPRRPGQPFIYCGRFMPGRFTGHPLGNPFKMSAKESLAARQRCLQRYREWLDSLPNKQQLLQELADQVRQTGYPLACWRSPRTAATTCA